MQFLFLKYLTENSFILLVYWKEDLIYSFSLAKQPKSTKLYTQFAVNRRHTLAYRPGGTPIYNLRGCSLKFSKETPKSYHIGCGSSQFYSLKVTSEIFIHSNNIGILKKIAKGQQVLL